MGILTNLKKTLEAAVKIEKIIVDSYFFNDNQRGTVTFLHKNKWDSDWKIQMAYRAIAFDLDDTLIDTTNELIPLACRKIHTYLVSQGYIADFKDFERLRKEFVKTRSHKEFFKSIAPSLINEQNKSDLLPTMNRYFYEPDIPVNLQMLAGAEENLNALSGRYQLFIVTAGVLSAQKRKLAQLKIDRFVKPDNILIVADGAYLTKKAAFEKIISNSQIKPEELLAIGNRLSQEIRMAKQLNGHTCYFKFGEHADDSPQDKFEMPDYTIYSHKELIKVCQL